MADITLGKPDGFVQSAFSCADVDLYLSIPQAGMSNPEVFKDNFMYLNTATGIDISTYRDKSAVRPLGFTRPDGYTKGVRTVAGAFSTYLDGTNPINSLRLVYADGKSIGENLVVADSLPPFNLFGIAVSEHGAAMTFFVQGVEIVQTEQPIHITDRILEITYQFKATDYGPLSDSSIGEFKRALAKLRRIPAVNENLEALRNQGDQFRNATET